MDGSAHDEAVEAAARVLDPDAFAPSLTPRGEELRADWRVQATQRAWRIIRAYLAHRRARDGAGLYVVPADLPPGFHNSTDPRGFYPQGYNAALAAVRASGEHHPREAGDG